jgi:hypothetical protein
MPEQRYEKCKAISVTASLENRDYGRMESAALNTRHASIRKSWH